MIQEVRNPLLLPDILKLAEFVPDTPIAALEKMLINGMSSKDAKIIIHKKYDTVTSFIYASIEEFRGQDSIFIQSCYITPENDNIGHEFLARMRTWAKERGIKNLIMITRRSHEGFERKYHFKPVSTIMQREV